MQQVKYRLVNPRLAPRRTKLEMPGWAGQPEPRADGSQEFAWHCAPFTEGAQYGIEVLYPHDNELHVSRKSGKLVFDGDFGPRPHNSGDLMWPPFRSFGQDYYTYQLLLDLKVEKDWAVRTEPHPRFYTDPTDTVPIAVPALLRTEWWPMISFVVFKSPVEGHTHIFRPDEPMLQILILPVIADFTLAAMEWTRRKRRNGRCAGAASTAADHRLPPIPPGRREPTPCSTAPTGICYARPKHAKGNDAQASPCASPALLLLSLQNFVLDSIERKRHACNAESFSRRRMTDLWNPNARPAFCRATANRKAARCANFLVAFGLARRSMSRSA